MKFCPYCGSTKLVQIQRLSNELPTSAPLISSATLTALFSQLAKGLKLPPLAGMLVGIVASGIALTIQQQYAHKRPPKYSFIMCCLDCQQSFDCPDQMDSDSSIPPNFSI